MAGSGTIREVNLDGLRLDAFGDVDISLKGGKFDNESIATSGRNYNKKTRHNQEADALTVRASALQHELLNELNDKTIPFKISFTDANGDRFTDFGNIDYVSYTTADQKATIKLQPENGFIIFVG